ncbi:MAG: hypothetical protein H6706_07810 [Myxococcales bacterium]|nr:hypothetical protein [Myxococcales bacterium]
MKSLISLLFLCLAAPAIAAPAQAGGYALELVDEGGAPLATFNHRGQTYVVGQYGLRYNVRVVNRTGARIEAVVTVDGRDVVTGEHGSYQNRGYVIDPYGSVTVEGFRQSHSQVAAFRFTSPGDSYAGRRGSVRNNGVIGVAVFREKTYRPRPQPIARPRRYSRGDELRKQRADLDMLEGEDVADARAGAAAAEASPAPDVATRGGGGYGRMSRRPAAPARQNLGTQYGESMYSSVVEVPFQRRSGRPDTVLSLYYDDWDGLRAKGVPVDPPYYSGTPDPFPRRFAPPPR